MYDEGMRHACLQLQHEIALPPIARHPSENAFKAGPHCNIVVPPVCTFDKVREAIMWKLWIKSIIAHGLTDRKSALPFRCSDWWFCSVQFSAGINVSCMVLSIVTITNRSLELIPAGNSTTPTLHKEPPLIRDTPTCHKGSSLMAGGGVIYLNFVAD